MAFPISKADVLAFKLADSVSFHTLCGGTSFIRASIRAKDPQGNNPFGTPEQTRDIDCESNLRDYSDTPVTKFRAFEMIHSCKWSDEWQTIAYCLRPGDELTLYWGRNARRCPVHEKADLVGDCLSLVVWRGPKIKLAFLINIYIGEDNTARMVRAA